MSSALIAMSGGVDSSVAAFLIKQQGYDCTGVTMKLFSNEDIFDDVIARENTCCSLSDVEDARSVAFSLDMPFFVFNFTHDFKEQVIERFIDAYKNGATPNPCIDCNRYMKFDKLFLRAQVLGIDYVVSGHYAIIEKNPENGRFLLKKAVDDSKDQSYVLYSMTQEQLAHTLFPLGSLSKSDVRDIAEKQGFLNAKKRDSQDICFVPDGDYSSFIEGFTGESFLPGNFVDSSGKVLGKHKGIARYTVGQRKGLGLSFPQPMYVKSIDPKTNSVELCENNELFSVAVNAVDFNWISCDKIDAPTRVKAKIRYNHKEDFATVTQTSDSSVYVEFDTPQRAIAKGQAVVLYDGDIVMGGGTIA